MESKAIPSFFEISINTQKFSQFTTALNCILNSHDKSIQQHTRELAQIRLNFEDKLNRIRNEVEYQSEKNEKKRKEDSQYFNSFLNDWTKKHEIFAHEWSSRIAGFEDEHKMIKNKMQGLDQSKNEQIANCLRGQVEQMMMDCKEYLQREMGNVNVKVVEMEQELKSSAATNDFLLKNIMEAYQKRGPNEKEKDMEIITHHKKTTPQPSRYIGGDRGFILEQMTIKQGRDKKKKKIQEKCEQQNLQYASISAKLDAIETRLSAKENESLNKVVWAGRKQIEVVNSQASQKSLSLSMNKIEVERKNLEQNITMKLEHIEQIIEQKFTKIEKEHIKLTNSLDLLADQTDINNRKMEKERSKLADLAQQIKRFQDKKLDEKLIDNMMTMMKRQNRNLEQEVEKKVPNESFNKEKLRVSEKIQFITQSLGEKADKEEIKRAFQFVQDKMKEIILIIADDIQQEKEGAIKRIPFKCLSCDKDLQASQPNTHRNDGDKKTANVSRCGTSQLRKRIRMANGDEK